MREAFGAINHELLMLERRLRALELSIQNLPTAKRVEAPAVNASPETVPSESSKQPSATVEDRIAAALDNISRQAADFEVRKHAAPTREADDVEMRIGATWFNRIGAILLLLGVAFFVKYSFDQGWIGPLTRVLLGTATGLALIGAGELALRRDMRQFSVGMIGAGIAMLYLSVFGAHSLYQLIDTNSAFMLYIAVTVLGAGLSLHARLLPLAVIAIIGAFATPIAVSTGRNAQVELMTYLLFVDVGFLIVGHVRRWDAVRILCWVGTAALFAGWMHEHYEPEALNRTLAFLTSFYVVFLGEMTVATRRNRADEPAAMALLIHLTNGAFLGLTYYLAQHEYDKWMGLFAVATGGASWLLAWLTRPAMRFGSACVFALAHDGAVMIALAAPLQFDGRSVPIAWSIQALVGCIAARWVTSSWLRLKVAAILVAAGAHLAMYGKSDQSLMATMVVYPLWHLNRFILCVGLVAVCAFLGAAALVVRRKIERDDEAWACGLAVIGLAALIGVTADQYERYVATFCWLAIVVVSRMLSRSASVILGLGVVLMVMTVGKYLGWDLVEATGGNWKTLHGVGFHRAMYTALGVAGCALLISGSISRIPQKWVSEGGAELLGAVLTVSAALVLVAFGTFEIVRVFEFEPLRDRFTSSGRAMQTTLSVFWSVSATVLLIVGMMRSIPPIRYMAIGLFGLTVVKLVLVDLAYLNVLYRVISFIGLGVLLLLASLMYQKRSQRLARASGQQPNG